MAVTKPNPTLMTGNEISYIGKLIQEGNYQFGGKDDKDAVAIKAYLEQMGRIPTAQELAIAEPQFQGPNGNAWLASQVQQQQMLDQLPDIEKKILDQQKGYITDALNSQRDAATQYYSKGNQGYEQLAGSLNGMGLLNEGAFSKALGQTLGSDTSQQIGAAVAGTAIPSIQSFTGLQTQPAQQAIGQPYALQGQGYEWQQFLAQEQLAQALAGGGGGFQAAPVFQGAASGATAGSAGGPWGAAIGGVAGAGLGATAGQKKK